MNDRKVDEVVSETDAVNEYSNNKIQYHLSKIDYHTKKIGVENVDEDSRLNALRFLVVYGHRAYDEVVAIQNAGEIERVVIHSSCGNCGEIPNTPLLDYSTDSGVDVDVDALEVA